MPVFKKRTEVLQEQLIQGDGGGAGRGGGKDPKGRVQGGGGWGHQGNYDGFQGYQTGAIDTSEHIFSSIISKQVVKVVGNGRLSRFHQNIFVDTTYIQNYIHKNFLDKKKRCNYWFSVALI